MSPWFRDSREVTAMLRRVYLCVVLLSAFIMSGCNIFGLWGSWEGTATYREFNIYGSVCSIVTGKFVMDLQQVGDSVSGTIEYYPISYRNVTPAGEVGYPPAENHLHFDTVLEGSKFSFATDTTDWEFSTSDSALVGTATNTDDYFYFGISTDAGGIVLTR